MRKKLKKEKLKSEGKIRVEEKRMYLETLES